ncbi:MAG: hypothetical protein JWO67_75, partial [Streptosporangiaceae bacterium]|nr:hypothetical protein [Streptosporangiaceae bacterium]
GAIDGEIVDDPADVEAAWHQIVTAASTHGMTTAELENEFAGEHGGMHPSSASVAQLNAFLTILKGARA